ncbi:unnamed protein product [Mytilus edulis]|uniref:Uncharacterized protein n=1 Tax=Mytilus edulis TaxID=6550 RepID=A0A8S3VGR2_MYTED|nr:unnamed protein product [Mytilus edulis]
MHFGGVPTSTSVTHTLSRSVNSAGTISSVPGTAMGLNLPGSRPPLSYCGYMLPNTGTQPLPSWSQPPWPQSYPYGGFMPNQPGFWPYRDNFYGPPSGVATAPPLAPALPVAVSLTSAVAPSTTVPDSQASSSSHGTQVSDHASPLDGLQKLLLDFGESFKAEFSTLSSRMTLLENRVSSHQPSPAKSVECDEGRMTSFLFPLGVMKGLSSLMRMLKVLLLPRYRRRPLSLLLSQLNNLPPRRLRILLP